MPNGDRILQGLGEAVAHARGERAAVREHVTVSRAELDALRAVAEAARKLIAATHLQHDTRVAPVKYTTRWGEMVALSESLTALDKAREAGR